MEAQVQNAVEVALDPQAQYALKQEVRNLQAHATAAANLKALAFIAQVKDSPDGWRVALSLLTNQPSRYVTIDSDRLLTTKASPRSPFCIADPRFSYQKRVDLC